uniref:Uncharacterized protein n=1 Tax=Ascaris lumbricoides TaxID=6252 RepID=A0A0M3HX30_ASCLU
MEREHIRFPLQIQRRRNLLWFAGVEWRGGLCTGVEEGTITEERDRPKRRWKRKVK